MNFDVQTGGAIFNRPLLLDSRAAGSLVQAFAYGLAPPALANGGCSTAYSANSNDEYIPLKQGIAVIDIQGFLVHKLGGTRPVDGMTGYLGIRQLFLAALEHPRVRGIILAIDSHGGDVAGCFDVADMIFAARGKKPIWAVLDDNACAAAYALASAADWVTIPRTGSAGGIGVIALIADISQAMKMQGIKVNVLTFGARKADGTQVLPLTTQARKNFQDEVNQIGSMFARTVSRNRKMNFSKILTMDGASFMGRAALQRGLVDAVRSPAQAFADMTAKYRF